MLGPSPSVRPQLDYFSAAITVTHITTNLNDHCWQKARKQELIFYVHLTFWLFQFSSPCHCWYLSPQTESGPAATSELWPNTYDFTIPFSHPLLSNFLSTRQSWQFQSPLPFQTQRGLMQEHHGPRTQGQVSSMQLNHLFHVTILQFSFPLMHRSTRQSWSLDNFRVLFHLQGGEE